MKKIYTKPEIELFTLVSAEGIGTDELVQQSAVAAQSLKSKAEFANILNY